MEKKLREGDLGEKKVDGKNNYNDRDGGSDGVSLSSRIVRVDGVDVKREFKP